MNLTQPSRRSFLSSLAILSASAAFASVPDVLFPARPKADLKKEWESFYKISGGVSHSGDVHEDAGNKFTNCKGHSYKKGDAVYFTKEGLLALPTWIFWENDKRKPADAFITFYEHKEGSLKKAVTYNRFEMEAIYKAYEQLNGLSFIKSTTPEKLTVKTLIKKRSRKQDARYSKEKETIFENHFIYNI